MKKKCSAPGCRRRAHTKGLCRGHYLRRRGGRPLEGPIRTCVRGSIAKRLRAHVQIDRATGCHVWMGNRDNGGYGRMSIGPGVRAAHRIAWELANGPIPEGMLVLHTCDNPACCNPEHLKLGTQGENMRDRIKRGRGPGSRALDLELHPQWGKRAGRRSLAGHPHCQRDPGRGCAPAQPPPRDRRPDGSRPSGLPWGESGLVALRLLEVALAPGADIGFDASGIRQAFRAVDEGQFP